MSTDTVGHALLLNFRERLLRLVEENYQLRGRVKALQNTQKLVLSKTRQSALSPPATVLPNPKHSLHSTKHQSSNLRASSSSRTSSANSQTKTISPSDDPSTETLSSGQTLTTTTSSSIPLVYSRQNIVKPPSYKTVTLNRPNTPPPKPPQRTRKHRTISNYTTNATSSSTNTVMTSLASRGALIVLEGLDRVGKSTLAKRLVDHLERTKRPAIYHKFPDRTTAVGKLINEYLVDSTKKIDNHTMHLLFSANRWEFNTSIRHAISEGTTVIVDRYSYSGVAYSSAKSELSMEWCRSMERGLPRPDLVIYLELPKEQQYNRPGFGDERFENQELQESIRKQYEVIINSSEDNWMRVDVDSKSVDQVLGEIIIPVKQCLEACADKPLGDLNL